MPDATCCIVLSSAKAVCATKVIKAEDCADVTLRMCCREGKIGFLRIKHRVNVLLSRARHGMYLLGNPDCLLAASTRQGDIWPQVCT